MDSIHANPRQPRRRFEPEATAGLASSLKQQGVLQPIVVRPRNEGGYELIAGERRWRAAREAGLADPAGARTRRRRPRDALLLALVENVAREQLSPVEEARAYASLVDEFELSLGDVAERVGRSKPAVSNRLRLLELPEEVLWMVARGELTEGHARAVLSLPEHDERKRLAKRIVREGMSVRGAEKAAQEGGAVASPARGDEDRPGARRARPRGGRAPDRAPGPRRRGQARAPFRRGAPPRRARRDAGGSLATGERRLDQLAEARVESGSADSSEAHVIGLVGREAAPLGIFARGASASADAPLLQKAWAILDSNQGPPPYQSGALTN